MWRRTSAKNVGNKDTTNNLLVVRTLVKINHNNHQLQYLLVHVVHFKYENADVHTVLLFRINRTWIYMQF